MKARVVILLLVLGLGAIAVGWVYESRLRQTIETRQLDIPDNIDYFLTNLNYRAMTSAGKVDFIFDSPRLEHFPRQDVSRIETPALQVFQDSELWLIDALHGEFAHRDNRLQLRDQVLVQKDGPEQLELHAEVLDFEPDRDLVSSDRRVLMLKRKLAVHVF